MHHTRYALGLVFLCSIAMTFGSAQRAGMPLKNQDSEAVFHKLLVTTGAVQIDCLSVNNYPLLGHDRLYPLFLKKDWANIATLAWQRCYITSDFFETWLGKFNRAMKSSSLKFNTLKDARAPWQPHLYCISCLAQGYILTRSNGTESTEPSEVWLEFYRFQVSNDQYIVKPGRKPGGFIRVGRLR